MDSDPIALGRRAPDDITSIVLDIVSHIQFKFMGMLLLVFIMLSSDVFIGRVLSRFKGAVDFKHLTSWGVSLQGMSLVICMIIIDTLIRQKII